ncbi:MAG: hypothetical protein LPK03_15780, partial [Pontibacter sp.]|nr:hypothetical protein [Pontibacter sp.]
MHNLIPRDAGLRLRRFQQWSRMRQEHLSQAYSITQDTVLNYLKRQIERGNWREVQEVLRGKPMTKAGKFLFNELRIDVVGKLVMRLGLRKLVAAALVLVLLPIIL